MMNISCNETASTVPYPPLLSINASSSTLYLCHPHLGTHPAPDISPLNVYDPHPGNHPAPDISPLNV